MSMIYIIINYILIKLFLVLLFFFVFAFFGVLWKLYTFDFPKLKSYNVLINVENVNSIHFCFRYNVLIVIIKYNSLLNCVSDILFLIFYLKLIG